VVERLRGSILNVIFFFQYLTIQSVFCTPFMDACRHWDNLVIQKLINDKACPGFVRALHQHVRLYLDKTKLAFAQNINSNAARLGTSHKTSNKSACKPDNDAQR
jgi:hypothetical protein